MQEIKKLAVVMVAMATGLTSCISVSVERNNKKASQSEGEYSSPTQLAQHEQPTVIPVAPAPEKVLVDHTIVSGDSLWKIANDYGTTIKEIQAANGMTDVNIYAGKVIKVPTDKPPGEETETDSSVDALVPQDGFKPAFISS